jgi:RHS repeat-associated protein
MTGTVFVSMPPVRPQAIKNDMPMSARRARMSRSKLAILRWAAVMLCIIAGLAVLGSARAQTTVEYVHTDALGSVRAISDEHGNIIERFEYEPYGALIGKANLDAPGYTGHVMDAATGLTYMQQRYMDPQLGVFLSVDPVTAYGGDMRHFNRYAYAYNNPYKFTDPDGRLPIIVPIIFGVTAYFTSNYANAPAPGEKTASMSPGEQVAAALPPGRVLAPVKMAINANKPRAGNGAGEKKQRNAPPGPDPAANGAPHSRIERSGPDGQYTTHNGDGTYKQYRGSGQDHGGIPRPNVKETKLNTAPDGKQYPSKPEVRPARPEEKPRGK